MNAVSGTDQSHTDKWETPHLLAVCLDLSGPGGHMSRKRLISRSSAELGEISTREIVEELSLLEQHRAGMCLCVCCIKRLKESL